VKGIHTHSIDERCVIFAKYLIEHNATVRSVASHFGISKSTVHKDITQALKRVDHGLYTESAEILEKNKRERHIRGGEATRQKYIAKSTK
jgi:putative DeoR family transcriptional regulator (stage III sporulation protein D)